MQREREEQAQLKQFRRKRDPQPESITSKSNVWDRLIAKGKDYEKN